VGGTSGTHGRGATKVHKVSVAKPERKRPLGRPMRRWEDGIRMDLREIGWRVCGVDSVDSEYGPVDSCCECGDEHLGSDTTQFI
jgi:hypothetical protein